MECSVLLEFIFKTCRPTSSYTTASKKESCNTTHIVNQTLYRICCLLRAFLKQFLSAILPKPAICSLQAVSLRMTTNCKDVNPLAAFARHFPKHVKPLYRKSDNHQKMSVPTSSINLSKCEQCPQEHEHRTTLRHNRLFTNFSSRVHLIVPTRI